jgi:hypothetical protein
MNTKPERSAWKPFAITSVVLTLSLGCLCLPAGITSTPTSAPTSAPTFLPAKTLTPSALPVETATTTEVLHSQGPWLLIDTDQGLFATNPDGSGLKQLTQFDYWDYDLRSAIQPGGSLVAFISPAGYDFHHMTLNLLSLPDGKITQVTTLTSPATESYADQSAGDDGIEAMRAVRDAHHFAWSPDGKRLAFVGLMDGPTAEIYVYYTATGSIIRISHDDSQDYWPSWSPDGSSLLYFGAHGFGTGAGFDSSGVWLASGASMDVTLLYTPAGGNEELNGWLDSTTAVLDTWSQPNGSGKLRLYDVVSKHKTMLRDSPIIGAQADSKRGAVIFADGHGLFMLTDVNKNPARVSEAEVARIDPLEPGEYFFTVYFKDGSLATYGTSDMDHLVSPITTTSGLEVAMYAWIWGWTSEDASEPGAWITGTGVDIGRIFNYNARLPVWDQNNNLLFFAPLADNGTSLYRTTFDAHYGDLAEVAHLDADVRAVTWLGYP